MKTYTSGLTLLELITYVAILAILTSLAAPTLGRFLEKQRIIAQTHSIRQILTKTRGLAVTMGESISVCAVDKDSKCTRGKPYRFVIYRDINHNGRLDTGDHKIEHLKVDTHTKIFVRLALNAKSLTYNRRGFINYGGGIVVCPLANKPALIRKITFSGAGRIYSAPDRDGDGRIETVDGKIVEC